MYALELSDSNTSVVEKSIKSSDFENVVLVGIIQVTEVPRLSLLLIPRFVLGVSVGMASPSRSPYNS